MRGILHMSRTQNENSLLDTFMVLGEKLLIFLAFAICINCVYAFAEFCLSR